MDLQFRMVCLGSIPIVLNILRLIPVEDESLQILHKLLYNLPGRIEFIKRNIMQFNGFASNRAELEFKEQLSLLSDAEIRSVAYILALPNVETDDLVRRIVTILNSFQITYDIETDENGIVTMNSKQPTTKKRVQFQRQINRLQFQSRILQYELDSSGSDDSDSESIFSDGHILE